MVRKVNVNERRGDTRPYANPLFLQVCIPIPSDEGGVQVKGNLLDKSVLGDARSVLECDGPKISNAFLSAV